MSDFSIYLNEENMYAVAVDTQWTVAELRELLATTNQKWRVCISGIKVAEE